MHNTSLDSEKANITSVLFLCDSLSRLGVNVTLAVPESKRLKTVESINSFVEEFIGRQFIFDILTYPKIRLMEKFNVIGSFFAIQKILKQSQADLCYVRMTLYLSFSIKLGIPVIFESHNSLLHTKYRLLDKFWRKKLINYSATDKLIKFVAISQALADYWAENGISKQKILALHDGFDQHSFKKSLTLKMAREKLGLDDDKKIVTYAGSLYPDRGIDEIIKLAEIFSWVKFIVVGGPLDQKMFFEDIVSKKNIKNIIFTGRVPHAQVKTYLYAADVLLMIWSNRVPTIQYCSPLKMFEYMASGRIIVGHGFPTIKEVLTDGKSAYLSDPDSFDDLAEKLKKALSDAYPSKIADNAKKLAFEHYSWEKRAAEIIKNIHSQIK